MKKIVFLILAFTLFISPAKAEWMDNMVGGGVNTPTSGACANPSYGICYVPCNAAWFAAISVRLVYYDGSKYTNIGTARLGTYRTVTSASAFYHTDLYKTLSNITFWPALSNVTNGKSTNYATNIKAAVQRDMKNIFKYMDLNYDTVMKDIKNGKYPKHKPADGKKSTTGVRLLVEPLFTYATTGRCGTGGLSYGGTAKAMAEFGYNKYYGSAPYFWDEALGEYMNRMKLEKDDIGYTKASGVGTWSQWKSARSGWGVGIFSPFDEVESKPEKCNPGTSASSIKTCCTKLGITEGSTSKNTTEYLTRKLTDLEILDYCTTTPTKCNPGDTDLGVKDCCRKLNISNTNQTRNTTKYLTRVLSDAEINLLCTPEQVSAIPNCNYILKDTSVDNCTKDTGDVGIPENIFSSKYNSWQCIFRSPSSRYSEVKSYFDGMGVNKNDYCHIYCYDQISYQFPNIGTSTYSGRFLTVGYSSVYPAIYPVGYTYERVCRTTDAKDSDKGLINYDLFKVDIERNERRVTDTWDSYQTWKAKQKACDTATFTGTETKKVGSKTYKYYNYSGTAKYMNETVKCDYKLSSNDPSYYSKPNYKYQIDSALSSYNYFLSRRNEYLGQINQCNSFPTSVKFNPEVYLTYDEPVYGTTLKLDSRSGTTVTYNYYKGGNAKMSADEARNYITNSPKTDSIRVSSCKSTGCKYDQYIHFKANAWTETVAKKYVDYYLPENLNLYINKYSGQSFNTAAEAGVNYTTMDVTNLPIHYSTKPGDYGFKLETKTFGSGNQLESYAFDKASFGGKTYDYEEDYLCSYNVSCKKVVIKDQTDCDYYKTNCPTEYEKFGCGSGFIFRPIATESKEAAFPGSDGKGRTPGGAWNNDSTIKYHITDSRGVKGDEIYKLSPMYEITLTPKLISEIKKYNDKMDTKFVTVYEDSMPTTGIAGYTSLEGVECKDNGGHCLSDKIREWGVKGCAISGRDTGFLKCSGVQKW